MVATISLREIEMKDAEIILSWRNDAITRKFSINSDIIEYKNHVVWLETVIDNPNRDILMAEVNDIPVGHIRFDREFIEVSITVAPDYRYSGIGSELLKKSSDLYLENNKDGILLARIKPDNTASLKAFKNAGYREDRKGINARKLIEKLE